MRGNNSSNNASANKRLSSSSVTLATDAVDDANNEIRNSVQSSSNNNSNNNSNIAASPKPFKSMTIWVMGRFEIGRDALNRYIDMYGGQTLAAYNAVRLSPLYCCC